MHNLAIICSVLAFALPTVSAKDRYENPEAPHRIRLTETVVAAYLENGPEAAERALDAYRAEMLEEGLSERRIHGALWREAQLHSGKRHPELGEIFYRRILLESTNGDLSGQTSPNSDFILLGNLISRCNSQGKLAESHKWCAFIERLMTAKGVSLELDRYRDEGPLYPWLPLARDRDFPLRYADQILPGASDSDRFLKYSYMMGFEEIADQAYMEGDWARAAELAEWMRKLALAQKDNPFNLSEFSTSHIRLQHHDGTVLQSRIAWLHGFESEALAILNETVETYPSGAYWSWHYGWLRQLIWRAKRGEADPSVLEGLRKIHPRMEANKYASSYLPFRNLVAQTWILYATGQKIAAFDLLRQLEDDPDSREEDVLKLRIDLSLRENDADPELETKFLRLLRLYRESGKKILEPGLYARYAEYLALSGRWDEAIAIQRQALALFESFQIHARAAEAQARLAIYLRESGDSKAAMLALAPLPATLDRPLPSRIRAYIDEALRDIPAQPDAGQRPPTFADLQPLSVQSVTLPGQSARARFTLANSGAQTTAGTLALRGPVEALELDSNTGEVRAKIDLRKTAVESSLALSLAPGELIPILLETTRHNTNDEGQVEVRWSDTGNQTVKWHYSTGETAANSIVTNASRIRSNPFYLVPLFHTLRRPDAQSPSTVDFRIVASSPMRIEVYDETRRHLIYIDDNGDGDLGDTGDLLARDSNGNLLPDIAFAPGTLDCGIEVLFEEKTPAPEGALAYLEIQLWQQGEWIPYARNTITALNDGP